MKRTLILKRFPSPYGVSFILIGERVVVAELEAFVSSFRLLTEYHSFLF